ncbi:MAG: hypothetical protein PHT12_01855 [Patescibacteria group bacterium]|nr:hypothetical protein [Patescibacteria group bacterium]
MADSTAAFRAVREEQVPESAKQSRLERDFGLPGAEEMRRLQDERERWQKAVEADSDDQEAAQELRIAEKSLELFFAEHDRAGAFKFNKFGREAQGWFSAEDETAIIRREANGDFRLADGQENRRLLFVDVGELDRFNKEGGQAGGDAALAASTTLVEKLVRETLGRPSGKGPGYEIFRFGNSSYMVSLDDMEETPFSQLVEELNRERPKVEGMSESVPLTAVGIRVKEGLDLLNEAKLDLYPDEHPLGDFEAARELITLTSQLADHRLEQAKFKARVNRVLEVMDSRTPAEAEAFYQAYLHKQLSGKGFDSLDDFRDESRLTRLDELAEDAANQRLDLDARFETAEQRIIAAHRDARRCRSFFPPAPSEGPVKLAEIPKQTKGQEVLAASQRELEKIAGKMGSGDRSAALREAQREHQLVVARRDAGTGLYNRGEYYGNLQADLKEGKDPTLVFVDMGFMKYFDVKGGRSVGNDAARLTAHVMEQAVAQVREEVPAEEEMDVEIYRYGGDEYAVLVREGGVTVADRVVAKIDELRKAAGAVPAGPRSKEEYGPTELVFNVGVCEKRTLDAVMKDLIEAGVVSDEVLNDPEALLNLQAEVMTHTADLGMEEEKCVGRFLQMIGELRSPAAGDATERAQIDARLEASAKALLADMGGRDYLMATVARRDLEGSALEAEVRQYVARTLKEKHEASANRSELKNRIIEAHARIQNLELEIHRLQRVTETQQQEIGGLHEQMQSLKARLEAAHEDRRRIVEGKRGVDEAYRQP